jgi:hypothetical protein
VLNKEEDAIGEGEGGGKSFASIGLYIAHLLMHHDELDGGA